MYQNPELCPCHDLQCVHGLMLNIPTFLPKALQNSLTMVLNSNFFNHIDILVMRAIYRYPCFLLCNHFLPNVKGNAVNVQEIRVMEAFINYILQFGNLNKQQTDFILGKTKVLELQKEEYFSEAGRVPRHVGFNLQGILRFCYYNNKGEEITHSFVEENNFVSDQQKFEVQVVASEYIQAVTSDTKRFCI